MRDWLLRCDTTQSEKEPMGRWLHLFLLSMIGMAILVVVGEIALPTLALAKPLPINMLALVALLGLYAANRRGYVTPTAIAMLGVLIVTIFAAPLTVALDPTLVLDYPFFLILVLIAAGIFLPWRYVLVVSTILVGLIIIYYSTDLVIGMAAIRGGHPNAVTTSGVISTLLILLGCAFSWISSRIIDSNVQLQQSRHQALRIVNEELLTTHQRDHDLGSEILPLVAQLLAISEEHTQNLLLQAIAISQVSSSTTELYRTATEITGHAVDLQRIAEETKEGVRRSQELFNGSIEVGEQNRRQIQHVLELLYGIMDSSQDIKRFVLDIQELSDTTHLLALNATIEAAGAGVYGNRFSVVADWVGKLAGTGLQLAHQIEPLVRTLQQSGEETIKATKAGVIVADNMERLATEMNAMQLTVTAAIARIDGLVAVITSATTQQSVSTGQVLDTMLQMTSDADRTRRVMNVLGGAVLLLDRTAGQLQQSDRRSVNER